MGVLAALRSICTQAVTGLMITASHNPVHENGVKLVDPSGGMLAVSWESYSDLLANAPDEDDFIQVVEHIVINEKIQRKGKTGEMVYLGRDTRPSGASLLEAALKVILPLGSQCTWCRSRQRSASARHGNPDHSSVALDGPMF